MRWSPRSPLSHMGLIGGARLGVLYRIVLGQKIEGGWRGEWCRRFGKRMISVWGEILSLEKEWNNFLNVDFVIRFSPFVFDFLPIIFVGCCFLLVVLILLFFDLFMVFIRFWCFGLLLFGYGKGMELGFVCSRPALLTLLCNKGKRARLCQKSSNIWHLWLTDFIQNGTQIHIMLNFGT